MYSKLIVKDEDCYIIIVYGTIREGSLLFKFSMLHYHSCVYLVFHCQCLQETYVYHLLCHCMSCKCFEQLLYPTEIVKIVAYSNQLDDRDLL